MQRLSIDHRARMGRGETSVPARTRRRRARVNLPSVTLAAVTATAAMLCLVGLTWPDAAAELALPSLAAGHETAAADALMAPGVDYDLATRHNDAVLAQAPLSSTALIRRAYIADRKAGHLTPSVVESLQASYRAAPLGPDASTWRLAYVFNHWAQSPPALRAKATDEMAAYARFNPGAASLARAIASPSGRLAAALIMRRVDGGILQALPEAGRPLG